MQRRGHDTPFRPVRGSAEERRGLDERLARNAALSEADTAHPVAPAPVHQHDLPSPARGVQRGGVASGAGPGDDEVGRLGYLSDDHQARPSRCAGSQRCRAMLSMNAWRCSPSFRRWSVDTQTGSTGRT